MNDFWKSRSRPMGSVLKMKTGSASDSSLQTPKPAEPVGSGSSQMKINAATSPPPPPAKSEPRRAAHLGFDHDLACGVFAGVFEIPAMTVSVDVVEFVNPLTNRTERTENWLRTNDMLAILIRELDKSQSQVSISVVRPDTPPNQRAQLIKQREEAARRVSDLREQISCLLQTRQAYTKATEQGVKILITPS